MEVLGLLHQFRQGALLILHAFASNSLSGSCGYVQGVTVIVPVMYWWIEH